MAIERLESIHQLGGSFDLILLENPVVLNLAVKDPPLEFTQLQQVVPFVNLAEESKPPHLEMELHLVLHKL